nr:hypothetical protein [Enterococcus sp. DIV0212c]
MKINRRLLLLLLIIPFFKNCLENQVYAESLVERTNIATLKEPEQFNESASNRENSVDTLPFTESPYVTWLDKTGNYVKGKSLPTLDEVLVLKYAGKDLVDDTTINGSMWSGRNVTLDKNSVITVKNAGIYRGTPITLKIKLLGAKNTIQRGAEDASLDFLTYYDNMNLELTVLDDEGQEVLTNILVPVKKKTPSANSELFMGSSELANVIVEDDPIFDELNVTKFPENTQKYSVQWPQKSSSTYTFNFLYQNSKQLHGGVSIEGDGYTFSLLDKKAKVITPVKYQQPDILPETDDSGKKILGSITQFLPQEPSEKYYTDLTVTVNTNGYNQWIDEADFWNQIKIVDKDGKDYSNDPNITKSIDKSNNTFSVTYKKSLLEKLGTTSDNSLVIKMALSLDGKNTKLQSILNQEDDYFYIPIEVKNNLSDKIIQKELLTKNTNIQLADSAYVTWLDKAGNYVKGKALPALDEVLVVKYVGKDLVKDTTINGEIWSGAEETLDENTVVTVKNAGIYRGVPVSLKIKLLGAKNKIKRGEKDAALDFLTYYNDMNLELIVLDEEGQEISTNMLVPVQKKAPSANSALFMGSAELKNVIIEDNSMFDELTVTRFPEITQKYNVHWPSQRTSTYVFNFLYQKPKNMHGGVPLKGDGYTFSLLDKTAKVIIPVNYQAPNSVPQKDDSGKKIIGSIAQFLPQEPTSNSYKEVTVSVNTNGYNKWLSEEEFWKQIKILDTAGKDYSNDPNIVKTIDKANNCFSVTYKKDFVEKLGNEGDNTLILDFALALDTKNETLESTFNKEDGYLHIPLEVKNNQADKVTKNKFPIKALLPTGEPVETTVALGSSTTDLKPEKVVKNLKSNIDSDKIEAIGFKEQMKFDKVGKFSVTVLIKSIKTGLSNAVEVPLTVSSEPAAYIMLPQSIELKDEKDTNYVSGHETISFIPAGTDENIKIKVTTDPIMMLTAGDETVNASIYKQDGFPLLEGEIMTILNSKNRKYDFKVQAKAEDFTKAALYNGQMTFSISN